MGPIQIRGLKMSFREKVMKKLNHSDLRPWAHKVKYLWPILGLIMLIIMPFLHAIHATWEVRDDIKSDAYDILRMMMFRVKSSKEQK